jgi:hypothetical protein
MLRGDSKGCIQIWICLSNQTSNQVFDILRYYKVYEPYSVFCPSETLLLLSGGMCGRRRVYTKSFKKQQKEEDIIR